MIARSPGRYRNRYRSRDSIPGSIATFDTDSDPMAVSPWRSGGATWSRAFDVLLQPGVHLPQHVQDVFRAA